MPAKSKVNRNDISAEVKEPVAEVAADAKEAAPEAKPAVAKKPRAPRTAKKPAAEPALCARLMKARWFRMKACP